MTTTCRPLPSVKLAGRSDVTVVWARTPPGEKANVEMKAARNETARRCENIMTCLARIPQKWLRALRQEFAQMFESARTDTFGMKPRHRTPRGTGQSSRRREISLTIRHTSLFAVLALSRIV